MTRPHSKADARPSKRQKPAKPYADFPLFSHASGKWAKKIRRRIHYFGRWEDPDGALREYLAVKDDLLAGRTPADTPGELTVLEAVNRFLTAKKRRVESGELSPRSFHDYAMTAGRILENFGKTVAVSQLRPADFGRYRAKLYNTRGHVSVGNEIQRVRTLFKWCFDAELIDRPVRFGPDFKKPSKRAVRKGQQGRRKKLFAPAEVHALLDESDIHLRAMVMLGINCGFGNSDCGNLPLAAVDLDAGWIDYARPKTGVDRRCPLWPETVKALGESLARRPAPTVESARDLFFVRREGIPWAREDTTNHVSKRTTAALNRAKVHRPGMSFYWLRHTFRTVADETRDQPAVDFLMGHADHSMAGHYRQEIADARLLAVTEHVRAWLYGGEHARLKIVG